MIYIHNIVNPMANMLSQYGYNFGDESIDKTPAHCQNMLFQLQKYDVNRIVSSGKGLVIADIH